ncbi:MAG: efflux RND transporter periplasmic adaptor subunit [Verrucomicrobiae bacterium]|nr:efflux RND transporter periplasmic adaptor subunit [Verrucomicrobiae bacterium]
MKNFRILNCLILLAGLTGCHRPAAPEQAYDPVVTGEKITFPPDSPQLASLEVAPAELRAPASIELSGRLIWNDDVTVRIFTPFAGRVRKIIADIGDTVEQNGPLAEIESPDFGQAQADARKAEGDLKLAQRSLARLRELYAHGAAAQKDVEAAEDAAVQAEAEHSRAISKLAAYGASADSLDEIFNLRSPLAGTVVDKTVGAGQEIRPDQMLANVPEITAPCYTVSDPAHLWIQIDATEVDLPHLRPGQEFTVTSRAFSGQSFTGRVEKVAESLDPNTRTIKVRGAVDNQQRLLKAEMFVNVSLPGEAAADISAPAPAVFLKGQKHYVFVQDQPGEFTRREVTIGTEQAGRVLILNGLQAGQQVVTDGCVFLQQIME